MSSEKLVVEWNDKTRNKTETFETITNDADKEVEEFYDDITLDLNDKKTHFILICGVFNAKIGRKRDVTETSSGN